MEDHPDILARYRRMRSACRTLNTALMEQESLPVERAAKELGVRTGGPALLDADEMPVVMDHAFYRCPAEDGRTAIERYADEHPLAPPSDAAAVLTAMRNVYFSLFQVRQAVHGVGVRVTDALRRRRRFLADVSLSQTAAEGLVLASRVLPFGEFIMTTGAALAVSREVLARIREQMEAIGLSHMEVRATPSEAWCALEALVFGLCLRSDAGPRIQYRDVPASVTAPALSRASEGSAPTPRARGRPSATPTEGADRPDQPDA